MDKKQMMNVLVPALAAAAVVVLVGLLIVSGDGGAGSGAGKGGAGSARQVAAADRNAAGMSDTMPPLDAPEWKPGPGGMKVWDVKEGEGDPVPPAAEVFVHYSGWLTDGTSFDSSVKRGEPISFGLNGVIKGWTEGIPGMKPGGVRRLHIPFDWAYGESGRPPKIPARADLVFEVKLLGWQK